MGDAWYHIKSGRVVEVCLLKLINSQTISSYAIYSWHLRPLGNKFRKSFSWTLISSDTEYVEVAIGSVVGKFEAASAKGSF
jgi:hypothetical protein